MTIQLTHILQTSMFFQVITYIWNQCLNKLYSDYHFLNWERIRGSDLLSEDFWSLCSVPTNVFFCQSDDSKKDGWWTCIRWMQYIFITETCQVSVLDYLIKLMSSS